MKVELKQINNIDFKSEIKGLMQNKQLEFGFFENAKYENGTYVAQVARIQEYGTLKIPLRPFFRQAISKNSNKWFSIFKNQIISNNNVDLSLNQVGEVARGDIIESITQLNSPANAESTIKKKKSDNPLIDTGFLRASVSYKVK